MSDPWDLDDDYPDEDSIEGFGNKYLDHREMGLLLIQKLMARGNAWRGAADAAAELIDRQLFPILYELEGTDRGKANAQREAVSTLNRIKTQLFELNKVNILAQRAVLGVGGKFSAGKSCFINSLTDAGLPEGQSETTSIATYIVYDAQAGNLAITKYNHTVPLDDEAVEALTHEFSRIYQGIGFVRVIENLVLRSPTFRYHDIAILDTPGYSKADIGKSEDIADKEIALRQLRSADALVWLMDAETGGITQSDLEFLRSLESDVQILFVLNKADLRPEHTLQQIVSDTRQKVKNDPILGSHVFDVIAYSSFRMQTVIGGDSLERFLSAVSKQARKKKRLKDEVSNVMNQVEKNFQRQIRNLDKRKSTCNEILSGAYNPYRMQSVVRELTACNGRIAELMQTRNLALNSFQELIARIEDMERGMQERNVG